MADNDAQTRRQKHLNVNNPIPRLACVIRDRNELHARMLISNDRGHDQKNSRAKEIKHVNKPRKLHGSRKAGTLMHSTAEVAEMKF